MTRQVVKPEHLQGGVQVPWNNKIYWTDIGGVLGFQDASTLVSSASDGLNIKRVVELIDFPGVWEQKITYWNFVYVIWGATITKQDLWSFSTISTLAHQATSPTNAVLVWDDIYIFGITASTTVRCSRINLTSFTETWFISKATVMDNVTGVWACWDSSKLYYYRDGAAIEVVDVASFTFDTPITVTTTWTPVAISLQCNSSYLCYFIWNVLQRIDRTTFTLVTLAQAINGSTSSCFWMYKNRWFVSNWVKVSIIDINNMAVERDIVTSKTIFSWIIRNCDYLALKY